MKVMKRHRHISKSYSKKAKIEEDSDLNFNPRLNAGRSQPARDLRHRLMPAVKTSQPTVDLRHHLSTRKYVCVCLYVHVYTYIHIMHIYVYVCMCVCLYININPYN